jgi:hypothetical protein
MTAYSAALLDPLQRYPLDYSRRWTDHPLRIQSFMHLSPPPHRVSTFPYARWTLSPSPLGHWCARASRNHHASDRSRDWRRTTRIRIDDDNDRVWCVMRLSCWLGPSPVATGSSGGGPGKRGSGGVHRLAWLCNARSSTPSTSMSCVDDRRCGA